MKQRPRDAKPIRPDSGQPVRSFASAARASSRVFWSVPSIDPRLVQCFENADRLRVIRDGFGSVLEARVGLGPADERERDRDLQLDIVGIALREIATEVDCATVTAERCGTIAGFGLSGGQPGEIRRDFLLEVLVFRILGDEFLMNRQRRLEPPDGFGHVAAGQQHLAHFEFAHRHVVQGEDIRRISFGECLECGLRLDAGVRAPRPIGPERRARRRRWCR